LDARVHEPPAERSIGDLFGQLAEEAKTFARSEAGLYKAIARHRASKAKNGVIALVAAGLLANAALVVLLMGFALGLAELVGPIFGALIVVAVVMVLAFLLVRYGAGKMTALSGDEEERAALAAGERLS
jgi:uncharacterized membrane protein